MFASDNDNNNNKGVLEAKAHTTNKQTKKQTWVGYTEGFAHVSERGSLLLTEPMIHSTLHQQAQKTK